MTHVIFRHWLRASVQMSMSLLVFYELALTCVSSTQALRAADLKKFNRNYLQLSVSMSASKYNQRLRVILTGHKWHRRKLYANTVSSFHQLTQRWVEEEFQTVNFIILSFHLQRYIFLPVKLFLCIPCVSTFINFAPTLHLYPFVLQMVN